LPSLARDVRRMRGPRLGPSRAHRHASSPSSPIVLDASAKAVAVAAQCARRYLAMCDRAHESFTFTTTQSTVLTLSTT